MSGLMRLAAAALLATALSVPAAAETKEPMKLEVITFPGGHNWGTWSAMDNGFFAKHGVAVNLSPTPGSEFQMTNLHAGKFHIAMTAIDNVIAYREGQGPVKLDDPDMIAIMGTDNGFLRLASVPEVASIPELKGKELSVDAMTTGYAFVLRRMLDRNGLGLEDVKYVPAGGVMQRWGALQEKKHAATLLVTPFDIMAKAKGFNVLGRADDVLGAYQGGIAAVKASWAKENEAAVVGFIRGYRDGIAWLYDRGNKAKAIALLRKHLPNANEQMGEAIYGALLADKGGLTRDAEIDMAGVKTVLELRSAYAEPRKALTDTNKYMDLSYFQKAEKY